jgi:hypothetical protein
VRMRNNRSDSSRVLILNCGDSRLAIARWDDIRESRTEMKDCRENRGRSYSMEHEDDQGSCVKKKLGSFVHE